MPTIRPIKSGQFPRATEWNALAAAYNSGSIGSAGGGTGKRFANLAKGKNNSGSDRARFQCMMLDVPELTLDTDGTVDLIFGLDTADAAELPAILVGSIANGRIGDVIIDGLALALVGPASATTDLYAVPDAANHRLAPQAEESNIRLLAAPSTSVETLCPVLLGGGGGSSGVKIVQTPGAGIAARSGTTVSSANCTEYKLVAGTLTTNTDTLTVHNPWPFAIPASFYILAVRESIGSDWIAIHPGVTNVRWDSPDLEQTLDGSTYSIIDTAEVCS